MEDSTESWDRNAQRLHDHKNTLLELSHALEINISIMESMQQRGLQQLTSYECERYRDRINALQVETIRNQKRVETLIRRTDSLYSLVRVVSLKPALLLNVEGTAYICAQRESYNVRALEKVDAIL